MGLDFGIIRKRKGEAYKADTWDDIVWGRNCYEVRRTVLNNISTYDANKCEAELSIGTLNNLVIELAKSLENYNLNNEATLINDQYQKTLKFIFELAQGIFKDCLDYDFNDIKYEYRLIDSY